MILVEEMNANQRKLIIKLRNELAVKDKRLEKLEMFADWDENWSHCEGCQRWTLAEDMRTSEECGGSCCVWCLEFDKRDKLIESLSSSDPAARDSLIEHYKRRAEETK